MVHRPLVVLATLLALSLAALAQMPSSLPGGSSLPGSSLNAGSMSGSVRTSDGRPIANARIEVRSLSNGQVAGATYTSPNGSFDLIGLPFGSYEVHAISGVSDAMEMVEVHGGDNIVNLRLPQGGGEEAGEGGSTVSVAQFRVPAKARDTFRKAQKAMEKQKYDEAEKEVNKALEIFPRYANALTVRALLHMDAQRMADAVNDLQAAIQADPNYPLAYIVMGAALNQTSKFDDAIRTLQQGLRLNPASWQGYFEMGKSFVGKGDFPTALRNLERAEQMAPNTYAPLHLVKAHALLGMKSYNDAMTELEKYLEREPNGQGSAQVRQTLEQVRAFMATKK